MIGKVFGRWTVIKYDHKDKYSNKYYLCRCKCGIEKIVFRGGLISGDSKSCGCYNIEVLKGEKRYKWKLNEFRIHPNFVRIKASNCDKYFLVDLEDWEYLKEYTIFICSKGYPSINIDGIKHRIHRIIMNPQNGLVVDHINGDKLNNCKSNLRVCNNRQNGWNSKMPVTNRSGHKGVYKHSQTGKWVAQLRCNKITYSLGCYENIDDAVKARQDAEIKYFGEYRRVI